MVMKKGVWKILLLALAGTPAAWIGGVLVLTIFGALDVSLTNIQNAGYWWIVSIPAYAISLLYFLISSRYREKRDREKAVSALILYFEERLEKRGRKHPSDRQIETIHDMFLERIKIWGWSDSELWSKYFHNEKYSKYLFEIVDNFIETNNDRFGEQIQKNN